MPSLALPEHEQRRIILSLCEAIPPVLCKSCCTDCCGHVPFSHWEWNQIPPELRKGLVVNQVDVHPPLPGLTPRKVIFPMRTRLKHCRFVFWDKEGWMRLYSTRNDELKDNICVFLTADGFGCKIYQHRPIICRLFATMSNPKSACKHGCRSYPYLHWNLMVTMALAWHSVMELK